MTYNNLRMFDNNQGSCIAKTKKLAEAKKVVLLKLCLATIAADKLRVLRMPAIFINLNHYCPVKILDLEINRVDHHPLGR